MQTRRLGSNGPEISAIGFGAWEMGGAHWGPNPEEDQLHAAVHAGIEAGMNWIDTAEVYGNGTSEEILGRALAGDTDTLIFTKVAPKPAGSGFRRDEVRRGAERSLKHLGRDRIDVYQLHWPDAEVPVEETWEAMAGLVEDGIVQWIGVSNFDQKLIERCEAIRHVDSLQPHFSMLARDVQQKGLLDLCARNGTGVVPYGPLAYGLLTGAITADTEFHDKDWRSGKLGIGAYRFFEPEARAKHLGTVERLRPIAERHGITLAQLALAWTLHQPGVTAPIAGSRSPKHTAENAVAAGVALAEKDLEEIDAVLSEA